jgi:hypothetical protein
MFDWKVDEEAEWDEPQRPSLPPAPSRRSTRWLWLATAVILILAAALFYTRLDRQVAQTQIDLAEEVTAAFLLLWQADRQGDADLFAQLRHDTGLNAWRSEMDHIFSLGLLFDRSILGLLLTDTPPTVTNVTFSPDWQTAVLTARIPYQTATGPDPIYLDYPLFYERINGRWLLVPPPVDYWGDTLRPNGPVITLHAPEADAELATRLHADLETAVSHACQQLAQAEQSISQPTACPADLTITLRLQPRPGRLESLLLAARQDHFNLPANPLRRAHFDIGLPTFSLLGQPSDEAAYISLRDELSYWLLATILTAQIEGEPLTPVHRLWLQYQLDQLGFNPQPAPPAPTLNPPDQPPSAAVALLCADLDTLTVDLLRLDPETADSTRLYANTNHTQLDSLFQGQVLGLRPTGPSEYFRHDPLLLQTDGTPLTLPEPPAPSISPHFWPAAPGGQMAVVISRSESDHHAINLTACLTEDQADECRWYGLGQWPIWSPDGQQQLYMVVDDTAVTGSPQRRIQRGSLTGAGEVVDVGLSASVDFSPFWVDETTYGYARLPAAPEAQPPLDFDLVLANIADDEPELLVTAAELRALLPADPPPGYMLPQGVKRVAAQPGHFVIRVILFPSEPLPNLRPQQAAFFYDQAANELALLALGEAMFVTHNGRFLLQWPLQPLNLREEMSPDRQSWHLTWQDLTTGHSQQLTWPQQLGSGTAVPAHDWSPLDEWFLLLADNTLLLVEAAVPQSGYTIALADQVGDNYHCFDAVWMRTAESTTD